MNRSKKNNEARLAALAAYDIVDTGAEAEFDALTRLAAYIASTPIALITFLDQSRQWFKSKIGLTMDETPLEEAFCRYTIEQDQAMEVLDTQTDHRFVTHPFVVGDLSIRYYCGLPLITPEGFRLGSLCVLDQKPRQLTPFQQQALQTLAGEVMARLELKRQKKRLEIQGKQLEQANQELEQRVEQRTKQLQESNTALIETRAELDSFLYRASHDLKGPLASLEGLLQLVQMDRGSLEKNPYLPLMQQSIDKLDQVLNNLLTYSNNTHSLLNFQQIDFPELLGHTWQNLQQVKGYQRITLESHIQTLVPFYSDKERVSTMLTHLLKNCIVFQNFSGEQDQVKIWIESSLQQATLIIRDHGIGMQAEQVANLGNRFCRYSAQSTGSGLGLFLVRQIIGKLKGTFHVQSQKGKGTTITIVLPNALATHDSSLAKK